MRRVVGAAALLAAMGLTSAAALREPMQAAPPAASGAWAIVEWGTGAVVTSEHLTRLRQPTQPGSFLKIATLVAAFATGLATPETRVPCAGEATVKGHIVRCSEALASSGSNTAPCDFNASSAAS